VVVVKLSNPADRDRWLTFVESQPLPLAVECKPYKPTRTSEANRYLWGVVYAAFCERLEGWAAEDVHEYLLGECYGWERIEGMGRTRLKPLRRSSRMNKKEFADYVEFCIRKGAEHGVFVPSPEEA
jgi:hypothetical protein